MRVRPVALFHPTLRRSVLGLSVGFMWLGCSQSVPEPKSPGAAEAVEDSGPEAPETTTMAAAPEPGPPDGAVELSGDPPPIVDPEAERAERERVFARSLLANAPSSAGQLGVVFVAGQRTADLAWTVAVENRSEETFLIPADISLLELTLTPPPSADTEETSEAPKKAKAVPLPQVFGVLPKVAVDEILELSPGEVIVGSFDPRDRCPDEWLIEGTEVRASYGYAIETVVRWERGKRVERPITDVPPFVLESKESDGGAPVQSTKVLTSAPFVLGETYPLSELVLRAEDDPANAEATSNKDARAPESPLRLTLGDLGHSGSTLYKVLQLTLTNRTGEPLDIVIKRELLSFEVTGPRGATTCVLEPTKVDPLSHNFTRLGPGQSRSLAIRLPEACPAGTFDVPGQYNVMARYRSPSSGAEFGKSGFVGTVRADKGARFTVDGRPGQPTQTPFRKIRPTEVAPTRPKDGTSGPAALP